MTHPAFFVSPCHQGQYDMTRQADHSGGDREAGVRVCVGGQYEDLGGTRKWCRVQQRLGLRSGPGDGTMLEAGELLGGGMLKVTLSCQEREQGTDSRLMGIYAIRTAAHSAKCTFPGR